MWSEEKLTERLFFMNKKMDFTEEDSRLLSFERLEVWKAAMLLAKDIYGLILKFPQSERFALSDQLRRSSVSIASNIAEGAGRSVLKERIRFVDIALGSLNEAFCQLILAGEFNYISEEEPEMMREKFLQETKMLFGYRSWLEKQMPR